MDKMSRLWRTSVHQAMVIFREGLIGILPAVEKARIGWREPQSYDDWDRIAIALYESFVVDAIIHARECSGWSRPIAYDRRVQQYGATCTYLFDANGDKRWPFICFQTSTTPFDTCVFAALGQDGTVQELRMRPFSSARFWAVSGLNFTAGADTLTVEL